MTSTSTKINNFYLDFSLFIILITSFAGHAQTTFQKIYGGNGDEGLAKVLQTTDGGFLYAGYTVSWGSSSLRDGYIMKTDASGSTQWSKTYGEPSLDDEIFDIITASDGGYAFVGTAQDPITLATKILFGKIDSVGNVQYQNSYVYTTWEIGWKIVQSNDGGYMIMADSRVNGWYYDILMLKIGPTGNLQWSKAHDGTATIFEFNPTFVHHTSDGGYVIVAEYDAALGNPLIFKTDSAGSEIWKYQYQSLDSNFQFRVKGAAYVPNQGYYIAGYVHHLVTANLYALLIKVGLDGTLRWAKSYSSPTSIPADGFFNIEYAMDDKLVLTGLHADSAAVPHWTGVLIDTSGVPVWGKTYTYLDASLGQNIFLSNNVLPTNDGGYLFASWGTTGFSSKDIYAIKTDASGNSGCWESPVELTSTNFPMAFNSYSGFSSVGTTQSAPAWTLNSGSNVSTLCLYVDSIPTNVSQNINAEHGISVYPNPASGVINIESGDKNISAIEIFNPLGENVSALSVNAYRTQVPVTFLSDGIYFLKIYFSDKSAVLKKIHVIHSK